MLSSLPGLLNVALAPENKNCQRAKKFPLSVMYKIKAIEQKILSAKLKKISIKSGS
ncbi:TPA: hypothetical protein RPE19_003795 [Escherichia coli]|uniref:hypothetical protein n=1 Tax=Escherichia coli TaxID=562 RepID=UPI001FF24663|nr:hypothetical protein [Escherichia coli]HDY2987678.1 hypothetical protein [Escherichia coli]HDY2995984.1 hypothetical protein [Escherichia coli]